MKGTLTNVVADLAALEAMAPPVIGYTSMKLRTTMSIASGLGEVSVALPPTVAGFVVVYVSAEECMLNEGCTREEVQTVNIGPRGGRQ